MKGCFKAEASGPEDTAEEDEEICRGRAFLFGFSWAWEVCDMGFGVAISKLLHQMGNFDLTDF